MSACLLLVICAGGRFSIHLNPASCANHARGLVLASAARGMQSGRGWLVGVQSFEKVVRGGARERVGGVLTTANCRGGALAGFRYSKFRGMSWSDLFLTPRAPLIPLLHSISLTFRSHSGTRSLSRTLTHLLSLTSSFPRSMTPALMHPTKDACTQSLQRLTDSPSLVIPTASLASLLPFP